MRVYASGYASLKTTHVGHLQFGQVLGSPQPLQCRQQRRLATRAREANQRPCLQGKVLRWPALSTFASQGGYRHIIRLMGTFGEALKYKLNSNLTLPLLPLVSVHYV